MLPQDALVEGNKKQDFCDALTPKGAFERIQGNAPINIPPILVIPVP